MDLWFTEEHNENKRFCYRVSEYLFSEQSEFQKVDVINTPGCGKMMLIDGLVMITDSDEFVYHEVIVHLPVCAHGNPKRVCVIGGGDGGTVRELVRYPGIESITLCEIDKVVVDAARQFFPQVSSGYADPRVEIRIGDGVAFMKECRDEFDLVIVDSTDPIGPGEGLFSREFYKNVASALKPGGFMMAQSESPWYHKSILSRIQKNIEGGFMKRFVYVAPIPTYPSGTWSWTMATNEEDFELTKIQTTMLPKPTEYLNHKNMISGFNLPEFVVRKFDI